MSKPFNYCVGHEHDDGSIGCYTYHSEVHFGSAEDAEGFLKYVKRQSPEEKWKIYELVEKTK